MNTSTNTIASQIAATITNATTALASGNTEATTSLATITESKFAVERFVPEKYLDTFGFMNTFEIFHNTLMQYFFAFVVAFLVFIFLPVLWAWFAKYLSMATEKTMPDFSVLVKDQLKKINKKIFLIIAIYLGILTLTLPSYITLTLKGIVYALIGIQIAIIVGPLLEPLIRSIPTLNKPELKPITNRLITFSKMLLWAFVGIFSLSSLGMDTAPLLGSIGVLGIGGALAFQQMVPGFIKVLSFHFSKNFSIGDKIAAGTHQGVVEEIDITTTRIRKANGDLTEVKNEDLMSAIVIPADGPHIISDTIKINISLQNEMQSFNMVESIFKSCLENIGEANFEKVLFTDIKGAGLAADLNYSVAIEKKIEIRHTLLTKLISELKSQNISFTGV
jgi:small-conductance mechanosensitive channel